MRPTRVVIDLSAIKHNLEQIRSYTGRKIMMAIKADAYGHGAETVGRFVQDKSLADMLGVSCIEEGIHLREANVTLPILIFGLINDTKEDIDAIFFHNLIPTIVDTTIINALIQGAHSWNRAVHVHVKTDTGMGRLAYYPEKTLEVIKQISMYKEIIISGVYTHFPLSDVTDTAFTSEQINRFNQMLTSVKRLDINLGLRHCANSGAIISQTDSYMDMVRPGILCYGHYPSDQLQKKLDIKPAMTLKTGIMFIKRVKKGTGLSYGHTYITKKDTSIATIPVGYADGYPRALSNKAQVLIQGKTYPVVGRICMDQSLIDLGDDLYPVGQEVTLFGDTIITAESVASWGNTIPYEITCNMSRRVPRMYSESN